MSPFLGGNRDLDAGLNVIRKHYLGNRAGAAIVKLGRLKDAGAHRCHLRTVVGADNGGHQVAAKRRARLLQQTRLRIHRKHRAIGRKARLQAHGHTGRRLAAKRGRAVQNGLGLALGHQIVDQASIDLRVVLTQALVTTDQNFVRAGTNQVFEVPERALGAHADQCHQTAAACISKLAPLAHELEGHGCHGIVLVSLHEDPNVSICVKVYRASGLVALDRDGVDGAGVDAPAAQDTAVGYAGTAIGALALHHNAARGAGANAATTADADFAIDNQPAHLCHPLDNLGKFYRLLGRRSLNGLARLVTVGHKRAHDLRR